MTSPSQLDWGRMVTDRASYKTAAREEEDTEERAKSATGLRHVQRDEACARRLRRSTNPGHPDAHGFQHALLVAPPPAKSRYIEACQELGILAKFARAARDGRTGEEIDLSGLGVGDMQLQALLCDNGLFPAEQLRRWRLRDARLTSAGAAAVAATLTARTELLDLSRNDIGARGAEHISDTMLRCLLPCLRRLDLSVNNLRNDAASVLAIGLAQCPMLLRLELNHNTIQDGNALGKMVADHPNLMRLSMHCNFLASWGAASLFQGILRNSRNGGRLADVDVAWNGIGDHGSTVGAEAIAAALRESATLYHLDLSYNALDAAGCKVVGEGLRDNHYLYGLHMVGNAATIDADGFLLPLGECVAPAPTVPQDGLPALRFGDPRSGPSGLLAGSKRWKKDSSPVGTSICTSAKTAFNVPAGPWTDDDVLRERDPLEQQTTCWACEGWERVELVWPLLPEEPAPSAVWAFTSIDGFRAAMRLRRSTSGPPRMLGARMVPAGCQLRVIFQVDSALRVPRGMEVEPLAAPAEIELRACPELATLTPPPDQDVVRSQQKIEPGGAVEHTLVLRLAVAGLVERSSRPFSPACNVSGRRTVLMDDPGGAGPVQMPRVTETEFRMRTKQARSKPFFAGFKRESDAVVRECFVLDWSRAKVGRIVGEKDRVAVQDLLQSNYRSLLSIYRIISAMGVTGETGFGVSQMEASDCIAEAGLIDDTTRLSDVDRLFIAAKVMPVDMKRGLSVKNDKGLVRHQFLELLLRLADQRYVQTGQAESIVEALGRVIDALAELGRSRIGELDGFLGALHTDAVDDVYKKHDALLHMAYARFSGKRTPPGLAKFMSVTEFQEFLEAVDGYNSEFLSRKSAVAFRMGMMTQAEESFCSRCQEMTFVEFQHALGAVVYLRSGGASAASPGHFAGLVDGFFSCNLVALVPTRRGQ